MEQVVVLNGQLGRLAVERYLGGGLFEVLHIAHLYKEPIEGMPFHLADDDTLYKGGKRFVCEGKCSRADRPLACRIFPLRMRVERADGKPVVTPIAGE